MCVRVDSWLLRICVLDVADLFISQSSSLSPSLHPVHFLFILTSNSRVTISFILSVEIVFPQWEVAPIKLGCIAD